MTFNRHPVGLFWCWKSWDGHGWVSLVVHVKGHLLLPTPPQNDAMSRTHSGTQPSSHTVILTCLFACLYKMIDTFYYTNSPSKPQFSPTNVPPASLLSSWWMGIDQRHLVLTVVKLRPQCFFPVGPAGTPVLGIGNLLLGQLRGETLCSTAQLYQFPRSIYVLIVLQLGNISCEWTCVHILELTFIRNVLNTS